MGLRQLQRELDHAERAVQDKRQQAGAFVEASRRRVKGWFGPWRIVAAGGLVGAVAGWRGGDSANSGEDRASAQPVEAAADHGSGFAAAIEQATSVVQLISLAAPLLAQYAPMRRPAESEYAESDGAAGRPTKASDPG